MRKSDFNGSSRELRGGGHLDESVYCVNCGAIFVWDEGRDCPACTLAAMIEALQEEVVDDV